MTLSVPIDYVIATKSVKKCAKSVKKCAPKRAVSFAKVCKYEPPSNTTGCFSQSDAPLQPECNQRNYRRRGSKAPSMLVLSKNDYDFIEENLFITGQSENHYHQEQQGVRALRARRLSIMTMLKQNLDRSCSLEPTGTLRRMSLDQKSNLGLATLLSPM